MGPTDIDHTQHGRLALSLPSMLVTCSPVRHVRRATSRRCVETCSHHDSYTTLHMCHARALKFELLDQRVDNAHMHV